MIGIGEKKTDELLSRTKKRQRKRLTNPLALKDINLFPPTCTTHNLGIFAHQCGHDDILKSVKEAPAPFAQCACIVRADVAHRVDDEAAL
jgi:hypothetical protein